ncbi:MAG: AMP-binding protein [Bacillota bacterium]|nr:AMP-binding protein [Bacillota bacterium]MDI7249066.1 AMP-binding protein [Bacillota bacterium]
MEAKTVYLRRPWVAHYARGVPETLAIPTVGVPHLFEESARKYAQQVAVNFYGTRIRYSDLRDQVYRFAAALAALGVRKGDRVGLYLLNTPEFVISYLAVLRLGAIVTPISPVYTSLEVRHQLADSGARAVICQDILYDNIAKTGLPLDHVVVTGIGEYLPWARKALGKSFLSKVARDIEIPRVEVRPGPGVHRFQELLRKYSPDPPAVEINPSEDLAVLPYTGGTTGPPKGAMLTHANLVAAREQSVNFWPVVEEGKERVIAFLPFYHIYGQVVVMLNTLLLGGTLVLFTTPDLDDIIDALDTHRATLLHGVPTFFEYLKEHPKTGLASWRRLKLIVSGADTLHETTVRLWEERTGTRIHEGYGLTETASISHANPLGRSKIGSFGVPVPNMGAAVVDPDTGEFVPPGEVGELVVSGPNVMRGYWNNPAETAVALVEIEGEKWFKTGDLVRMDEEGYFFFYDRKKDMIKYKGYSVFAREIEDYLYQHPQVKAAAVIGVPDPKVGQVVKAIVVLQKEARGKVSEEDILEYCRQGLAHYKVPRIVEFRGELPQTDVGKISRRELREELEEV